MPQAAHPRTCSRSTGRSASPQHRFFCGGCWDAAGSPTRSMLLDVHTVAPCRRPTAGADERVGRQPRQAVQYWVRAWGSTAWLRVTHVHLDDDFAARISAALGEGPACHRLTWHLALDRSRLLGSKEATAEAIRTGLERQGVDTADWWDRQLSLCLLRAAVQFSWEKAPGVGHEPAWSCDGAWNGGPWQ